jgi:hypothetical protein
MSETDKDWKIKVEKRLSDLEAALLDEREHKNLDLAKLGRLELRILDFVKAVWESSGKPAEYRKLSAQFSKSAQTAGTDFPAVMNNLVASTQLQLGVCEGRRVVLPDFARPTADQRALWGFETPEERETREVNEELKNMLARQD